MIIVTEERERERKGAKEETERERESELTKLSNAKGRKEREREDSQSGHTCVTNSELQYLRCPFVECAHATTRVTTTYKMRYTASN